MLKDEFCTHEPLRCVILRGAPQGVRASTPFSVSLRPAIPSRTRLISKLSTEYLAISNISPTFALAKEKRCHSSVGRAKDWKSLCPRFDSWWHHKQEASLKSGALLLIKALCSQTNSWWYHLRNASQSLRDVSSVEGVTWKYRTLLRKVWVRCSFSLKTHCTARCLQRVAQRYWAYGWGEKCTAPCLQGVSTGFVLIG